MWFECVVFRTRVLCGSVGLDYFCFSAFDVSFFALGSCLDSLSIFCSISNISRLENPLFYYSPNLVSESLACWLKSSIFFPDFNHSFPITYLVAPKIAVNCKFVVFPCPFSMSHCSCTWKKANIRKMTIRTPMSAIKGAPANHDT